MNKQELLAIAKPILFNTDMVRAILDNRKSCTRRAVKPKYSNTHFKFRTDKYGTEFIEMQNDVEGETWGKNGDGTTWRKLLAYRIPKPPYKVGDILYVRETWKLNDPCGEKDNGTLAAKLRFKTDENAYKYIRINSNTKLSSKWRPSIHMPKEVARIFLRVTGVRVERLQDITEEEAYKEGCGTKPVFCQDLNCNSCKHRRNYPNADRVNNGDCQGALFEFESLWNSTIKKFDLDKYGWNANPWVWVNEFERVDVDE